MANASQSHCLGNCLINFFLHHQAKCPIEVYLQRVGRSELSLIVKWMNKHKSLYPDVSGRLRLSGLECSRWEIQVSTPSWYKVGSSLDLSYRKIKRRVITWGLPEIKSQNHICYTDSPQLMVWLDHFFDLMMVQKWYTHSIRNHTSDTEFLYFPRPMIHYTILSLKAGLWQP